MITEEITDSFVFIESDRFFISVVEFALSGYVITQVCYKLALLFGVNIDMERNREKTCISNKIKEKREEIELKKKEFKAKKKSVQQAENSDLIMENQVQPAPTPVVYNKEDQVQPAPSPKMDN